MPIVGGRMRWPLEMARPVMRAVRQIAADAPDELTLWAHLLRFPCRRVEATTDPTGVFRSNRPV